MILIAHQLGHAVSAITVVTPTPPFSLRSHQVHVGGSVSRQAHVAGLKSSQTHVAGEVESEVRI